MQPSTRGCQSGEKADACCEAMTAECLACAAGLTEEEFCVQQPTIDGCKSQPVVKKVCCRAMTAPCLACAANTTKEEYCKMQPSTRGCQSGEEANACCEAMTAECLACAAGLTEEEC